MLSTYDCISYLAFATGHKQELAEAERCLASLAECLKPSVETEKNPAKTLVWTLWNRTPLLIGSRADAGLDELVQQVFARVGKSLAMTGGSHALAIATSAFEGRHRVGDDVVALLLYTPSELANKARENPELHLLAELLETRAAQAEKLPRPAGLEVPEGSAARSLVIWYLSLHVAAYLALLHEQKPEDSEAYRALAQETNRG